MATRNVLFVVVGAVVLGFLIRGWVDDSGSGQGPGQGKGFELLVPPPFTRTGGHTPVIGVGGGVVTGLDLSFDLWTPLAMDLIRVEPDTAISVTFVEIGGGGMVEKYTHRYALGDFRPALEEAAELITGQDRSSGKVSLPRFRPTIELPRKDFNFLMLKVELDLSTRLTGGPSEPGRGQWSATHFYPVGS